MKRQIVGGGKASEHFYQVVRMSSAGRHAQGNPEQRKLLSDWPLPRPRNWNQLLRDPQSTAELDAIRRSVNKGQPFGSENWVKRTAKRLGLESTCGVAVARGNASNNE